MEIKSSHRRFKIELKKKFTLNRFIKRKNETKYFNVAYTTRAKDWVLTIKSSNDSCMLWTVNSEQFFAICFFSPDDELCVAYVVVLYLFAPLLTTSYLILCVCVCASLIRELYWMCTLYVCVCAVKSERMSNNNNSSSAENPIAVSFAPFYLNRLFFRCSSLFLTVLLWSGVISSYFVIYYFRYSALLEWNLCMAVYSVH